MNKFLSSPSLAVPNNSMMEESFLSDDFSDESLMSSSVTKYSNQDSRNTRKIMEPETPYARHIMDSYHSHQTEIPSFSKYSVNAQSKCLKKATKSQQSVRPSFLEGRYDTYHSSTQLNNSINSSNSSLDATPLGKRPACIGKEATPVGKNLFKTLSSFGQSPSCGLNFTELDSGWDNSELDASCSTCGITSTSYQDEEDVYYDHNNDSKSLPQVRFMRHLRLCRMCNTGELCSKALLLERELPSFFEIGCETQIESSLTRNSTACSTLSSEVSHFSRSEEKRVKSTVFWSESVNTTTSLSTSFVSTCEDQGITNSPCYTEIEESFAVTVASDKTDFMEKPITKVPVTGHNIPLKRKSHLKRKLKKIGKYLHRVKNCDVPATEIKGQFTTLAFL